MCFLHNIFLNRDFSLDIVKKCIKILTVILISVLEGSVSHFFLCRPSILFYDM